MTTVGSSPTGAEAVAPAAAARRRLPLRRRRQARNATRSSSATTTPVDPADARRPVRRRRGQEPASELEPGDLRGRPSEVVGIDGLLRRLGDPRRVGADQADLLDRADIGVCSCLRLGNGRGGRLDRFKPGRCVGIDLAQPFDRRGFRDLRRERALRHGRDRQHTLDLGAVAMTASASVISASASPNFQSRIEV